MVSVSLVLSSVMETRIARMEAMKKTAVEAKDYARQEIRNVIQLPVLILVASLLPVTRIAAKWIASAHQVTSNVIREDAFWRPEDVMDKQIVKTTVMKRTVVNE
ncbi:hypothetical protein Chor_000835 [Crotalus horridus]